MSESKRDTGDYSFFYKPDEIPIGNNYFLGIGINSYKHFKSLNNAVKDVQDLAEVLTTQYTFEPENIDVISSDEATRRKILKTLHEYQEKVGTDDKLLIYYAGHGYLNPKNKLGYWIPVDATKDEIADLISNAEIQEIIRTYRAKHVLLISDSCFSASLLVRNAQVKDTSKYWEANNSRFIFTSGKEEVEDGEEGKNSPFAQEIIEALKSNKFEEINIGLLADQVTKNVGNNHKQKAEATPLFQSGHKGGQFVFYPRAHITGFQKAMYLNERNRKEEAVEELKKFLLNCQSLPNGYEFALTVLSNQLFRIEKIKNQFLDAELISKSEFNKYIQQLNFQLLNFLSNLNEYFYSVSDNRVIKALDFLRKDERYNAFYSMYEFNSTVKEFDLEIYRILTCFNIVEDLVRRWQIEFDEYHLFYSKYIFSCIILLLRINDNTNSLNPRLLTLRELLTKTLYREAAFFLVEESMICNKQSLSHSNIGELYFWVDMLKIKIDTLNYKRNSKTFEKKEEEIFENRILNAIVYLARNIELSAFEYKNQGEIKWVLKPDVTYSQFVDTLSTGKILYALGFVQPNSNVIITISSIEDLERKKLNGVISARKYLIEIESLIHYILRQLLENAPMSFHFLGSNNADIKNRTAREIFLEINKLFADGKIFDAINMALSLNLDGESKKAIMSIKNKLLLVEEDEVFTDKPKDLIDSRINALSAELIQFLRHLKEIMLKE